MFWATTPPSPSTALNGHNNVLSSNIVKFLASLFLISMVLKTNPLAVASKANSAGASQLVVDAKAEIEKVREQIQNIE